jgi:N-acetylneuraminate synthase
MKLYKIASADLTNVPFLRKIAKKKKPIILSTGASNLIEIDNAVRELYAHGCEQISLLHCVLNYPTPPKNANLNVIETLRRAYPELIIGYSDHVKPESEMMCVLASYMKGARIIEKHFTHDKSLPGNDHYHAMNCADLKRYYEHLNYIRDLSGTDDKNFLKSEELSRANARRSIVVKGNVKANTVLTEDMLTYKRPAHGISPIHWDDVVGKTLRVDLEDDHILKWTDLIL